MSSIALKKFHAQGGSVYALYPNAEIGDAISFIVAFQTISDYLDNLCDKTGLFNEASFRQLHLSLLDAVDPSSSINNYYLFYPFKGDNNYLKCLVYECRLKMSGLNSYSEVIEIIKKYIVMYSDLQTYKHLAPDIREAKLKKWAYRHLSQNDEISWWEFSAAAGSTLCIFALFVSAFNPNLNGDEVKLIENAYFPWICGLHILLDYYIDAQEDLWMGDLNFTGYYKNLKQCEERISFFIERSLDGCRSLPNPLFHTTVIKGLLAMYLSDPKASLGMNKIASQNLLKKSGKWTPAYYNLCRLLRFIGKL